MEKVSEIAFKLFLIFILWSNFSFFCYGNLGNELDKSNSNLTSLKVRELETNYNWTVANFSKNLISSIDNILELQTTLQILILDFNSNFTQNENKCIVELKSLRKFSCKGCGFTKILSQHFTGLINLIELDLSENQICALNDQAFDLNQNMELLNLAGNKLQVLHYLTFSKLKHLKSLNLSHNLIELPKSKPFIKSSSVKNLKLNDCNLVDLYRESFSEIINIEKLEMNSNQITILPADIFKLNTKLKSLFMESNKLRFFPISIFDYSPLQELCIDKNNFTKTKEFFNFLTKYEEKVYRTQNCNSDVKDFIENLSPSQENFLLSPSSTISTLSSTEFLPSKSPKINTVGISTFFIGSYLSIILLVQAIAFVLLILYLIKITKYEKLGGSSDGGDDSELNYANTILNDNDIYKVYNLDE